MDGGWAVGCPGWIAPLDEGFGIAFRDESIRPQAEPRFERNGLVVVTGIEVDG